MAFTTLLLPQPCPAAFGAGMRSFDTLGELYLGGYTEEARGTKREADDADTNVAPGLGGDKKRRKKAQVLEWDEEMRDAMPPVAAMRVLAPARKRKSPGDEDEDGEEKAVRNVKARRAVSPVPQETKDEGSNDSLVMSSILNSILTWFRPQALQILCPRLPSLRRPSCRSSPGGVGRRRRKLACAARPVASASLFLASPGCWMLSRTYWR